MNAFTHSIPKLYHDYAQKSSTTNETMVLDCPVYGANDIILTRVVKNAPETILSIYTSQGIPDVIKTFLALF